MSAIQKSFTVTFLVVMLGIALGGARESGAQEPPEEARPLALAEILDLLLAEADQDEIARQVELYRVAFELDNAATRELIRAGAEDPLLEAIERSGAQTLTITSPREGERCGPRVLVQGRAQQMPGKRLWVFAHRADLGVWWPQTGEVTVKEDGSWQQTAFLGQPQDVDFEFEILALWVDEAVHADLRRYLERGAASGEYPGIQLPDGGPRAMVTVLLVQGL